MNAMAKTVKPKITKSDVKKTKKADTGKLSDEELGKVGGGTESPKKCPHCGSRDIHWHMNGCFWYCGNCQEVIL